MKTVLFVLGRCLGNKIYCDNLVRIIDQIENIKPLYLFIDPKDYGEYESNINKIIPMFRSGFTVAKKIKLTIKEDFDYLFIKTFELVPGLINLIRKYPTILAHDSTHSCTYKLIIKQDSQKKTYYRLKNLITTPIYNLGISNVDVFLPLTNWVASSLMEDFNISSEKIIVTPPYVDLNIWRPNFNKKEDTKKTILFVGNDFKRKGGFLLLNIYRKYLANDCKLRIISNDEILESIKVTSDIEIISGLHHENLQQLINFYRTSDIFVFPTRKEWMGIVLLEAASVGLAIVATDIGGVSDIVKDNVNGYLMPYASSEEEWAGKIMNIIHNQEMAATFGLNSRKIAEELCNKKTYIDKIQTAFDMLQESFIQP